MSEIEATNLKMLFILHPSLTCVFWALQAVGEVESYLYSWGYGCVWGWQWLQLAVKDLVLLMLLLYTSTGESLKKAVGLLLPL